MSEDGIMYEKEMAVFLSAGPLIDNYQDLVSAGDVPRRTRFPFWTFHVIRPSPFRRQRRMSLAITVICCVNMSPACFVVSEFPGVLSHYETSSPNNLAQAMFARTSVN